MFMLYAVVAFVGMVMPASYVNFKHQVKSHQQFVGPRMAADVKLTAKGIRLPGYNR